MSKATHHEPDKGILVFLYSPFWNTTTQRGLSGDLTQESLEATSEHRTTGFENAAGVADPILVYADLIATGDPRNLETAQLLLDEYITEPNWQA